MCRMNCQISSGLKKRCAGENIGNSKQFSNFKSNSGKITILLENFSHDSRFLALPCTVKFMREIMSANNKNTQDC